MKKYSLQVKAILLFFIIFSLFTFERCATVGSPSGGPIDSIPPVLVSAEPLNSKTNFNSKSVEIQFNEYVQLKNLEKELIISPPFEKKPLIRIKGKGIYFEIDQSELKDSTTYIFNFGNAIVDLNQSNPFRNYTYVFSTGPILDSMGISGTLVDAFDLRPSKEPFWIMLYSNTEDSIPYKEVPIYVGRTAPEDGSYNIQYVKPGTYRLFALKESGNNFLYDNKNEWIAFSDSLITLDPSDFNNVQKTDTITDSTLVSVTDSILDVETQTQKIYSINHNFFAFKEPSTDTLQYFDNWKLVDNRLIYFVFNQSVSDSFNVSLQYYPENTDWYLRENSLNTDSINLWITDTALLNSDTLNLIVHYYKHDTLFQLTPTNDTLFVRKTRTANQSKMRLGKGKDREEQDNKADYLELDINIKHNGRVELNHSATIATKAPIKTIDHSKISFQKLVDTVYFDQGYNINNDSLRYNLTHFNYSIEEGTKYQLILLDSAYTDIYGKVNDTTEVVFTSKKLEQYATLNLEVSEVYGQVIVQLIDKKETVVDQRIISKNSTLEFEYLKPAEYTFKAIYDNNKNGKWDAGVYLKNQLPERVEYYDANIKVRENWEHAEKWELKLSKELSVND